MNRREFLIGVSAITLTAGCRRHQTDLSQTIADRLSKAWAVEFDKTYYAIMTGNPLIEDVPQIDGELLSGEIGLIHGMTFKWSEAA